MQLVVACALFACGGNRPVDKRQGPSLPPTASAPTPTPSTPTPPTPTTPAVTAPMPEPLEASTASNGSGGAVGTRTSWPCRNCITTVPASYVPSTAAPLVVSLHGDEGSPKTTHSLWKKAAADNGYILLSPECPRDLGCTGRWGTGDWHRDGPAGSVAWLDAQIDAVEGAYNIDRARIYLVGGSRGAVFVGFHADAFAPRIAAAAMYAGGYSSNTETCAACALPVYILVGAKDNLLDIATKARDWFVACGSEVVFDKMPGVRHSGAGKSLLGGKANTILAWFTARPNACLTKRPR
jgi:poly(3-hydroxybutyrate) depolymerase